MLELGTLVHEPVGLRSEAITIRALIQRPEAQPLIDARIRWNVEGFAQVPDREAFWKQLVYALLTSQQRSTEGSPLDRFVNQEPFAVPLSLYQTLTDDQVVGILKQFRFHDQVTRYLRCNHERVFVNGNGWSILAPLFEQLAQQRNVPPVQSHRELERKAARILTDQLRGVGPKQSRNLLQKFGLTRYEIPLDSRVAGWLRQSVGWSISNDDLSDRKTYEALLDRVQAVCADAGILPTLFDAAAYAIGTEKKASPTPTTTPGFVNRNGQVVIRNTALPGTDHMQSVYQLGCSTCGHVYGANGSDIHLRLCPSCQGSVAGFGCQHV
jgi:hypothetical protein